MATLIKKIFFSVGQGSGKLSLRASMELQMVTFCSYIEYARPIRKTKKTNAKVKRNFGNT